MINSCVRVSRKSICVVLMSVFTLTGCASKYGQQVTQVEYFPQCYSSIAELRASEDAYARTVATGSVVGALLGALGGYLATGKTEGALVGAAVGGVAGTAVGYSKAESDEASEGNRRMATYLQELDGDISGLDYVTASARLAIQCYDKQFKSSIASFKARKISKIELDKRYVEIRNGTQEASAILGVAIDSTLKKEEQYQKIIVEEARRLDEPVPAVSTAALPAKKPATVSKPSKTKKAPAKPKPSPVVLTTASSNPELNSMAQKSQELTQGRQQLQQETADISKMQDAWAADLEAIKS